MNYQNTTQVPNKILDAILPTLTGAEFKVLMVIIRQTFGWRKERDRMNYHQLIRKTGLSRRVIADTIQSLINQQHIIATDYYRNKLHTPELRKGKTSIFFSSPLYTSAENNQKVCTLSHQDVQKPLHNKTYISKPIQQNMFNQGTKLLSDAERIAQIEEMRKGDMN